MSPLSARHIRDKIRELDMKIRHFDRLYAALLRQPILSGASNIADARIERTDMKQFISSLRQQRANFAVIECECGL